MTVTDPQMEMAKTFLRVVINTPARSRAS